MAKISSSLGSWSSRFYEILNAVNPLDISWVNRVCVFDRTRVSDYAWSVESSKDKLREKIQICKDKAGIRGDKYPSSIEVWKKEIVDLAEGVSSSDPLPSRASPKNELVYNHDIARAATNKDLDLLSRNVSTYATLWVIDTYLGSGKGVDSGVLFDLIAKSEKNPQKKMASMYLEHFAKKMNWSIPRQLWIKTVYYFSSGIISGLIHTTFQNVLAEIRLSTDGKVEPIFEKLLDHLEKFLKDYREEKNLDDFTEKKDVPALCKELSPFLVNEFFPNTSFFKLIFGKLPLFSVPCWVLDSTIGAGLNFVLRRSLKSFLPTLLQTLSETALANLTAPKSEVNYPVNYRFAIPVVRFINDKIFGFSNMLQEPSVDILEPPPPFMAAKLEGVIDEVLRLSTNPSNDPMVKEGLRSGLINGGYQFMKFWQKEQENLLQQMVVLAGLPFTETQETPDIKTEAAEFELEWRKQEKLVQTLADRVFDIEARQYCGTPAFKVTYHLAKEHEKVKRYLEEGLSDIIGLKSSLKKAREDLKKTNCQGLDLSLSHHLAFWEGFLSMIKRSTKKHYPKPATEDLFREFLPLCQEGVAQVDRISQLQDEWVLYTRHKALKMHFYELSRLLEVKKSQDFDVLQVRRVLNKIEVLLPPNPLEVQILKRFIENFSELKNIENFLKDLESLKGDLKKQGRIKSESFELSFKAFLTKHPQLQQDKDFINLYKKYISFSSDGTPIEGVSKGIVLQDILRKIEKEVEDQSQTFKDLQLNLLHRIYPDKTSSELLVPLPMTSLLRELNSWVGKKVVGYGVLEKGNLESLQEGVEALYEHVELLEAKIQKMQPNPLYFPLESTLDFIEWSFGSLGNSWLLRKTKENLIRDITGVLTGISPLIMAKKEEGKRNLYSWIERLALYEMVKYFKAKSSN